MRNSNLYALCIYYDVENGIQCVPFLKCTIWEMTMKENNEMIANDIDKFPEFENIRNVILEAREKVATTLILL